MNSQTKVLKILNILFWIVITIICINQAFPLIEPKIINMYTDKKLVTDSNIINELTESITTYFSSINYKHYDKANMLNAYLNRKSYDKYELIYNKINTESAYKIIVKYAYEISNETYRCYVLVQDLTSDSQQFIGKTDKKEMYEIVIKLNTKNTTFKILNDNFKIDK